MPIHTKKICDMRDFLKYATNAANHIRVKLTRLINTFALSANSYRYPASHSDPD